MYLGIQTVRNDEKFEIEDELGEDDPSLISPFKNAIAINVSNPKVAMFVLAFFPQFIPSTANATLLMSILGVVYAGLSLVYFVGVALLAGYVRSLQIASNLTQQVIQYASGSVLLGFGLKLTFEERPAT